MKACSGIGASAAGSAPRDSFKGPHEATGQKDAK
jgi:hypothetical protein